MRILYLVHVSWLGGVQRSVIELARGMASQGHEVCVAAGGDPNGYLFRELARIPRIRTVFLVTFSPSPFLFYPKCFREVFALLSSFRPNIVHLNGVAAYLGSVCAWIRRIKAVYSPRGFILLDRHSRKGTAAFWLCEWLTIRLVSWILPSSLFEWEAMVRMLHLTHTRREVMGTVSEIVFPEPFPYAETQKDFTQRTGIQVGPPGPWILTIANLFSQKDIPTLVRAAEVVCAKFPQAHFVVIGAGPELPRIVSLISERALNARFHLAGALPHAVQYLPLFDLFVLSSMKEGSPGVLAEASAAGLPVVATRVGGVPELARHNWILIPPSEPRLLAEAIMRIIVTFHKTPPLANEYLARRFQERLTELESRYQKVMDT